MSKKVFEVGQRYMKWSIGKYLLLTMMMCSFAVQAHSWSIEYHLEVDSMVYTFSQDKIIQGKSVEFFFPAYEYYQTSLMSAIESASIGNSEIIELEFDTKSFGFNRINLEIDLYAEGIDTIQYFLKTTDDRLVQLGQNGIRQGYKYLPTRYLTTNSTNAEFKSILIVGKSKNVKRKFILGRLTGMKKIRFVSDCKMDVEMFVSKFPFEKQGDTFVELPNHYLKLHDFNWYSRLILKDCSSSYDSIQCISQFTDKLLNEYWLYDVYGISKSELLNRNALLSETTNSVNSYYRGMKEILASLNNCHMRLDAGDGNESSLQPIYFYNVKDEIAVTAIFDPTIENKIQLGDKLLSINNISLDQLYNDFAKTVFASTSHQREIKITQRLLFAAREKFGDSLLLEFQNNSKTYSIILNESNFSGKKIIPEGFKLAANNVIEKYNNIIYFPIYDDSHLVPYVYSYMDDLKNCEGMIIDLRGCPGGGHNFSTFFSYFISDNSLIAHLGSNPFSNGSDLIVKPSKQINMQAPIVVLIDARTTCYPELFINALRKNRADVHIMGTSNTGGSAQHIMRTALPHNAVLMHFEGITIDAFGQVIDDNRGIKPDTYVRFDSYKDLFPYSDKLKRYALKYLGYSIEDTEDNNESLVLSDEMAKRLFSKQFTQLISKFLKS